MGPFALMSARQNLVHAERLGQTERAKRIKARIKELEASQPADVDSIDEFHTGGGWYQIGDEKIRGKNAARDALETLNATQ